jgi:hypothetical protein
MYFHVELHIEFLKKCFSISAAERCGQWALLDAIQPLVGSTAAMARVHPEWVRRHGLARRRRFPPRVRKGGAASVLGRLGNPSSRAGSCERREGGPAGWTQSPGTTSPTA